jgi:hypothetical protein
MVTQQWFDFLLSFYCVVASQQYLIILRISFQAAYGVNIFAEYVNLMLGFPLDVDALMRKQCSPRYTCLSMKLNLDQKRTKLDKCLVDMKKLSCSDEVVEFTLFKNVGDVCSDTYYFAWLMIKDQCNTSFEKLTQTWNSCQKLFRFKFT